MTADTIPDKASFFTKIAYGSGATAFGIKDAGFNYFILIYYNQVLGLDAFLAGLALALAVAIDAISDLLIGYISDHWRSRLGRRHPFMYGAVIPVALTFFWLWNPPEVISNDKMWLFFYLLTMAVLVRSCITFFEVPNAAQGPELTRNYDDRTSLMAFRYVFGWLGGLSMTVLTLSVLIPMDPDGQMGATGYKWLGITGSLAMFVMMIASALGTHQQISEFYKPSRPMHFGPQVILRNFTGLFSNRSFNSVFASSLFFWCRCRPFTSACGVCEHLLLAAHAATNRHGACARHSSGARGVSDRAIAGEALGQTSRRNCRICLCHRVYATGFCCKTY